MVQQGRACEAPQLRAQAAAVRCEGICTGQTSVESLLLDHESYLKGPAVIFGASACYSRDRLVSLCSSELRWLLWGVNASAHDTLQ